MSNYIEKLNTDIQNYISKYLSPQQNHDWHMACQGDDILAWVTEEIENQEDLSKDWREDERGDWEDDFDWDENWNSHNDWEDDY